MCVCKAIGTDLLHSVCVLHAGWHVFSLSAGHRESGQHLERTSRACDSDQKQQGTVAFHYYPSSEGWLEQMFSTTMKGSGSLLQGMAVICIRRIQIQDIVLLP